MSDPASSPATMRGWAIRAYGEEMVLRDDLPVPTPIPASLMPVEAGGVPIVGLTAHETLIDVLRLVIHEIVRIDEAQRALDLVLGRHVRGKVVLRIV